MPLYVPRAGVLLGRLVRRLVDKPSIRATATLATRTVSVAAQVPEIDSEVTGWLVPRGYVPPLSPLSSVLGAARVAFERDQTSARTLADLGLRHPIPHVPLGGLPGVREGDDLREWVETGKERFPVERRRSQTP